MKSDFPQSAFCFLQQLSAFFNGFPISSMAFRFSSTAFQFSSMAFLFPRNPKKSIYGGKYMKDHHSSFVFPATRSPSFVIATRSPSFVIATRSPSFVITTRSLSFVIATHSPSLQNIHTLNILWTMHASHPTEMTKREMWMVITFYLTRTLIFIFLCLNKIKTQVKLKFYFGT